MECEEIDRENRRAVPGLALAQAVAARGRKREGRDDRQPAGAVRDAGNPEQQAGKEARAEQRREAIEAPDVQRRLRQVAPGKDERQKGERHVHQEDPRPARDRQDHGGDGRAGRDRDADHQRVDAKPASEA